MMGITVTGLFEIFGEVCKYDAEDELILPPKIQLFLTCLHTGFAEHWEVSLNGGYRESRL